MYIIHVCKIFTMTSCNIHYTRIVLCRICAYEICIGAALNIFDLIISHFFYRILCIVYPIYAIERRPMQGVPKNLRYSLWMPYSFATKMHRVRSVKRFFLRNHAIWIQTAIRHYNWVGLAKNNMGKIFCCHRRNGAYCMLRLCDLLIYLRVCALNSLRHVA